MGETELQRWVPGEVLSQSAEFPAGLRPLATCTSAGPRVGVSAATSSPWSSP